MCLQNQNKLMMVAQPKGGAISMANYANPNGINNQYGQRMDGTDKSSGWLGEIRMPDGNTVMTEYSFDMDGREMPSIIPNMHPAEINYIRETGNISDGAYATAISFANKRAKQGMSPFVNGVNSTRPLYEGESKFFRNNPNVAGMASEDNEVLINHFSPLSEKEKNAVFKNESIRRNFNMNGVPNISLTREQEANLAGTSYSNASNQNRVATTLARIMSGDPSGGIPTISQLEAIKKLNLK